MGENSHMQNWQDLRYFHALAQTGSLSAAARQLGVEHATIARRIAALEDATKLKLVDRRGRRLVLTGQGREMAVIAARMEAEALAVERLSAAGGALKAEVTISAPPAYAQYVLAEKLAQLRKTHPGLRITLIGETRYASLERREADIAIRLVRPEKGDLVLRKIDELSFRLYGTREYLESRAAGDWDYIAYDESMDGAPQQKWLSERAGLQGFAIRVSALDMQLRLAQLGCGVALIPGFMTPESSGLCVAEPEQSPLTRDVWLTIHSDIRNAPAIRAVTDALVAAESRSFLT